MQVVLRPATINDLDLLHYWDQQEHVIESNPNEDWDYASDLNAKKEWMEQFIAEVDGKAIGFINIIDPYLEESNYWGEVDKNLKAIDIWIGEKDFLNKGFGTQMMYTALDHCLRNGKVCGVLIDPLETNKDAIRFYKRIGFKFIEKRKFDNDICDVHYLSREEYENKRRDY